MLPLGVHCGRPQPGAREAMALSRSGGAAGGLLGTMGTHTRKSASVGEGLAHEVAAEGMGPGRQRE